MSVIGDAAGGKQNATLAVLGGPVGASAFFDRNAITDISQG